jgi:two-component system, LuxR family, response regulator FixJ
MSGKTVVCVVDDDAEVRLHLRALLAKAGYAVEDFPSAAAFLAAKAEEAGCLVSDLHMPDMDGLALLEEVMRRRNDLPVVLITGHGEIRMAVEAMKAGAADFIEKPLDDDVFLESVRNAVRLGERKRSLIAETLGAQMMLARLTPRERGVLEELVAGLSNKAAAHKLGLSQRTIEVYRAQIMSKLDARGLSDLVRLSLAAKRNPAKLINT